MFRVTALLGISLAMLGAAMAQEDAKPFFEQAGQKLLMHVVALVVDQRALLL